MADAFTLQIPVDEPYRALVPDVASRYAELSGGSPSDAAALASAVAAAMARLSSGAAAGASVSLAFRPGAAGLHVELSCNGHQETIDVTIPVARR
jgi:hypothetical protein